MPEAYRDPARPAAQRAADLLGRMTLAEKIGQMTQVEKNSLTPDQVTEHCIGSVLSGGGGNPTPNTPERWAAMVDGYQQAALRTRLGIPLLYGVDAVHGHNNVRGATIFPHNVGLGAARDAGLVERIGRATAEEIKATGVDWDFAPSVAVPRDVRWGRTYEGYGEDVELVTQLGVAYLRGMQGRAALATPKHFIGDGGTRWGTSKTVMLERQFMLDQGDTAVDEASLRRLFLPPYQAAVRAGARCIMVSFSSWNGVKMHSHRQLLTEVLKGELGFEGFLISDWQAIDQLPGDYDEQVAASINAGLDMIMVPFDFKRFVDSLTRVVSDGRVSIERLDDAVRRILTVKLELGLFEARPAADLGRVGAADHRALAREAVRKSLVLLKNDGPALPLAKDTPLILVAGPAADDVGLQCGGWTIEWQGQAGAITPGTTILDGLRRAAPAARIEFDPSGQFESVAEAIAEVGIAVVAEPPYAEGFGDRADLSLPAGAAAMIEAVRARCRRLVVILLSGRPLIVAGHLSNWDALVAAWLPGSEGAGVADVLFGDQDFAGRLPYTWPRWNTQLPFDFENLASQGCDAPLFPFGFGLHYGDPSPALPDCPPP